MICARYTDWRYLCAPGAPIDAAGYETWPRALLLFPPGDAGLNLVLPSLLTTFTAITCNGGALDAAPYVDEYDWYLSQRTDDPDAQMFMLARVDTLAGSRSGTVYLLATARAKQLYGISITKPNPSPAAAVLLFKDVWLYVRRRSDGRIMWGNFLTAANG